MKNTTIKDRSSETGPRRRGGINRRKKRSGGSVAVMTTSAIIRVIPRGLQSRTKAFTKEKRVRTTRIKKKMVATRNKGGEITGTWPQVPFSGDSIRLIFL